MTKRLLLVDYENVHKIDLSILDESYRAVVFVGASQNPPKAAAKPTTAHRFSRVDFQKIEGKGKNALDFHIAFHLGRTFETEPDTVCIVVSRDKGFDPLLRHLNMNGLLCRRVEGFDELVTESGTAKGDYAVSDEEVFVCGRCKRPSTIEHLGGRWCSVCGDFSEPPDPAQLPSNRAGYREASAHRQNRLFTGMQSGNTALVCGWCDQPSDMSGGIYDDGEWMCADCIARLSR